MAIHNKILLFKELELKLEQKLEHELYDRRVAKKQSLTIFYRKKVCDSYKV